MSEYLCVVGHGLEGEGEGERVSDSSHLGFTPRGGKLFATLAA